MSQHEREWERESAKRKRKRERVREKEGVCVFERERAARMTRKCVTAQRTYRERMKD